jgi:hypothetical protein
MAYLVGLAFGEQVSVTDCDLEAAVVSAVDDLRGVDVHGGQLGSQPWEQNVN